MFFLCLVCSGNLTANPSLSAVLSAGMVGYMEPEPTTRLLWQTDANTSEAHMHAIPCLNYQLCRTTQLYPHWGMVPPQPELEPEGQHFGKGGGGYEL